MYLGPLLQKSYNCRRIFPKQWYFKEKLPMTLRNKVSSKSDHVRERICAEQLSMLLACLKMADFDNGHCHKELEEFNECYSRERIKLKELKLAVKEGRLMPGQRRLSFAQVNNLLAQWPHPGGKNTRSNVRPPWMSYSDPLYKDF